MKRFVLCVALCGLFMFEESKADACPVSVLGVTRSAITAEPVILRERSILRQIVPRIQIIERQAIRERLQRRRQPVRAFLQELAK